MTRVVWRVEISLQGLRIERKNVIQVSLYSVSRVQPTEGLESSKGVLQITLNGNGSRVQPKGLKNIHYVFQVPPSPINLERASVVIHRQEQEFYVCDLQEASLLPSNGLGSVKDSDWVSLLEVAREVAVHSPVVKSDLHNFAGCHIPVWHKQTGRLCGQAVIRMFRIWVVYMLC